MKRRRRWKAESSVGIRLVVRITICAPAAVSDRRGAVEWSGGWEGWGAKVPRGSVRGGRGAGRRPGWRSGRSTTPACPIGRRTATRLRRRPAHTTSQRRSSVVSCWCRVVGYQDGVEGARFLEDVFDVLGSLAHVLAHQLGAVDHLQRLARLKTANQKGDHTSQRMEHARHTTRTRTRTRTHAHTTHTHDARTHARTHTHTDTHDAHARTQHGARRYPTASAARVLPTPGRP
jgi:hypothetical protein